MVLHFSDLIIPLNTWYEDESVFCTSVIKLNLLLKLDDGHKPTRYILMTGASLSHVQHSSFRQKQPKTESSYDGQLLYSTEKKEKDIHSFTEGWIALDRICQSHVYCVTCRQTTSKADMSVSFLKALITTENSLWRITIREGSTDSSLLHQIVHFMSYNFFFS